MTVHTDYRNMGATAARDGWRWFAGVCRAVLAVTPGHALACLLLYIVSQLSLIAALLTPWKLLVVLSAETFPRTLPAFMAVYDTRELVVVLSVAALGTFLLHLLCEAAISMVCGRGAGTVLDRHQKTGLFHSHRDQAAQLYRRLLRSLSALGCSLLAALWLAFAYPLLLLALVTYLCLGLALVRGWRSLPLRPESRPSLDLLTKAWWGGGFLYAVGWVVADYWHGGLPNLVAAFVALLLVRQTLVFAAVLFQNFRMLYDQRSRVEALFFAYTPWLPSARRDDGFHALLAPADREQWVRKLLRDADLAAGEMDIRCRAAESGKVVYMTVVGMGDPRAKAFMLKLYHRSLDSLAEHEREILQVADASWPAPLLLANERLEGHTCLVFDWSADKRWLVAHERAPLLRALREGLLGCTLPEMLVSRYDRSQASLSRRLRDVDWSYLRSFAPSERIARLCEPLESSWESLLGELDTLPRHLVLPTLDRRMMAAGESGSPTIYNWTRWRWEPVGAGWAFKKHPREELGDALAHAGTLREELRAVNVDQALRAAMLFEFDQLHNANDFVGLMALLEPICRNAGLSAAEVASG